MRFFFPKKYHYVPNLLSFFTIYGYIGLINRFKKLFPNSLQPFIYLKKDSDYF